MELGLVERRVPPNHPTDPRPRISQYVLADGYLRFYYALVDPWRSAIQLGQGRHVLDEIGDVTLDEFVSRTFEDVAAQYLMRMSGAGRIGALSHAGFWWFNGGDIDAVGMAGERLAVAASVKWRRTVVKPADLDDLRRDVAVAAPGATPGLFLFGRSGFDRNLAAEERVTLVELRDLFRADLEYER
jgi:hypothetical protein